MPQGSLIPTRGVQVEYSVEESQSFYVAVLWLARASKGNLFCLCVSLALPLWLICLLVGVFFRYFCLFYKIAGNTYQLWRK